MDSLRRSAVQNTADSIKQEEMGLRAPADGSGRIYPSEMTYTQFKNGTNILPVRSQRP